MVFLRTLGALILATVVGMVLGAIKDYLKLFPEADWAFTWPFAMGGAAFIGALLMALMRPVAITAGRPVSRAIAQGKPAGQKPGAASNRPNDQYGKMPGGGGTTGAGQHETSSEVPGMPTFDFDKARAGTGTSKPGDKPTEMS